MAVKKYRPFFWPSIQPVNFSIVFMKQSVTSEIYSVEFDIFDIGKYLVNRPFLFIIMVQKSLIGPYMIPDLNSVNLK
jgi:hypothetical protein